MSFIVVIDTNGQRQIHKVSLSPSKPVLIGRAWENDVIVNDEYIDARHLRLSMCEEGAIQVSDLGTRNGSRLIKKRVVGDISYALGTPIAIGDSTVVSLHDTDAAVAPAQRLDSVHLVSRVFGSFTWVLLATLVAAVVLIGKAHYASAAEATNEVLVGAFLESAMLAVIWCLLAGFIGKLFRHRTYLKLHWVLYCAALGMSFVLTILVDTLRFNLDTDMAETILVNASSSLLILLFAYGTLSLVTRLGSVRKLAGTSLLALMPVVFNVINPMLVEEHERWNSMANVDRVDLPPALFIGDPDTLQAHIRNTDAIFAELDALVDAAALKSDGKDDSTESTDNPVRLSNVHQE